METLNFIIEEQHKRNKILEETVTKLNDNNEKLIEKINKLEEFVNKINDELLITADSLKNNINCIHDQHKMMNEKIQNLQQTIIRPNQLENKDDYSSLDLSRIKNSIVDKTKNALNYLESYGF